MNFSYLNPNQNNMEATLEEKIVTGTSDTPPEPEEEEDENPPYHPFNVVLIGTQENTKEKAREYAKILKSKMIKELPSLKYSLWLDYKFKERVSLNQRYNFALLATQSPVLRLGDNYQLEDFRFLSIDGDNNFHRRVFDYGIISRVNDLWHFLFLKDKTKSYAGELKSPRELLKHLHKDFFTDEHIDDALTAWNKIFHINPTGNPLVFSQTYSGSEPIIVDAGKQLMGGMISAITSILSLHTAEKELNLGDSDVSLSISFRGQINNLFEDYRLEFSKFHQIDKLPPGFSKYGLMDFFGNEVSMGK